MLQIMNAISLSMVTGESGRIYFRELSSEEAASAAFRESIMGSLVSFVGHEDTARLFSTLLGVEIKANRGNARLQETWSLVGQYTGPRLPEGATTLLPDGAAIKWYLVCLGNPSSQAEVDAASAETIRSQSEELIKLKDELAALKARLDDRIKDSSPNSDEWRRH